MNSSFKQIRQSSLRPQRNAARSGSTNLRSASRLPSVGLSHDPSGEGIEIVQDGVVELTKNTKYCVARLPALPVILKGENEVSSGGTDQNTNYALVVSRDKTYVWNYSSPDHVPNTINFPSPDATNPPLSVLVASAPGSKEPGLVVIDVNTGVVTYWEAVGGAVADGLLNRRKSIQHNVGIYVGEWIDKFANVEPAGVVATTSSGRYILITLRDSNGKAFINSRTMRGGGAGFLSAMKESLMPQGHRRGVVSIKPGAVTGRSERQVLIVNETGDLSVWECSRSGYAKVLLDQRFKDLMLNSELLDLYPQAAATFLVHDVEINTAGECMYILASFTHSRDETYYLLYTISINNGTYKIYSTHRLQTYTTPSTRPPKLLFPEPGKTIFAVFSHGVVLLEAMPEKTQEHTLSRRWEDVITFRHEVTVEAAGVEDLILVNGKIARNCGIVLLATNGGVMRIERFEEPKISVETKQRALEPELAKTRVEQAVFYGYDAMPGFNPLNFEQTADYSPGVLEKVVLDISHEILTNTSIYMPPILPSLTDHLKLRVDCLQRLAKYLCNNQTSDQISVGARLQILWDLERTVVAKALWEHIDQNLSDDSINVLVTVINQNSKSSGGDPLREWFLHKANNIEQLLVDATEYCASARSPSVLIETNSILLTAIYKNALNIQVEYLPVFGLDRKSASSKSPWLSSPKLIQAFETQYNATRTAYNALGKGDKNSPELGTQTLFLVETLCALYTQRLSWIENGVSTDREEGERLSASYVEKRGAWLRQVVDTGDKQGAVRIAEDYFIYRSLVEILVEDWRVAVAADGENAGQPYVQSLQSYINSAGYDFASVLYQYFVETKQFKALMTMFPENGDYLDRFFENGRLSKVSWINDVNKLRYLEAGKTLLDANTSEDNIANNKLRLSIAKLCVLSGNGGKTALGKEIQTELQTSTAQNALTQQLSMIDDKSLEHLESLPALAKIADRVLERMQENRGISILELVDALTLIRIDTPDGRLNFYRALKIISESTLSDDRKQTNERLIFRRLLLADDWAKIVNTKSKSDAKVQAITEKTVLYQTLLKTLDEKLLSDASVEYLLSPQTLTESIGSFDQRYPFASESQLKAIKKDFETESELIKAALTKHSIDSWIKGIYSRAQTVVGGAQSKLSNTPQLKKH